MGKISGLICVSIIYSNVLSDHAELQILNGKNFPQGERKCRASSSTMGRLALCPSETGLMVSLHLRPRGATHAREPFPWNARRSLPEQATTRPSPAMRGRDRTLRGARAATDRRTVSNRGHATTARTPDGPVPYGTSTRKLGEASYRSRRRRLRRAGGRRAGTGATALPRPWLGARAAPGDDRWNDGGTCSLEVEERRLRGESARTQRRA